MIFLLIRLTLIGGLIFLFYKIYQMIFPPAFINCGRCQGRGYWEGTRRKEDCDVCNGSGKVERLRNMR